MTYTSMLKAPRRETSANITHGSTTGPASYVVTAANFCSVTPGNSPWASSAIEAAKETKFGTRYPRR